MSGAGQSGSWMPNNSQYKQVVADTGRKGSLGSNLSGLYGAVGNAQAGKSEVVQGNQYGDVASKDAENDKKKPVPFE